MQSLGEILINARTEKGYSIDQVAHETNISRNYIQYLENEDFEQFPAEAYLIGFLRNYSDYLGLEAEKIITLYRNHKRSEEPSPIEELVGKKKTVKFSPIWLVIIAAVAGLVFLGIKFIPLLSARMEENKVARQEIQEQRDPVQYTIEEELTELTIMDGDHLIFSQNDLIFEFKVVDKDDHYQISQVDNNTGESNNYDLRLGEELFLSLFKDSPDFRLLLEDYGLSSGEGRLSIRSLAETEEQVVEKQEQEVPSLSEIQVEAPSGQTSRQEEPQTILTLTSPERFTVDIKFRGYCLYRYQADNRERDERYYRDGDAFRLDVNRRIQLWLSNAGSAYMKINGEEVSLGQPGEVSVKSIQWIKNDQGTYDLVLLPVY